MLVYLGEEVFCCELTVHEMSVTALCHTHGGDLGHNYKTKTEVLQEISSKSMVFIYDLDKNAYGLLSA